MAVKVVRGTDKNKRNIGIHLFKPSKSEIADAKERAARDGYPRIYVHQTKKVVFEW